MNSKQQQQQQQQNHLVILSMKAVNGEKPHKEISRHTNRERCVRQKQADKQLLDLLVRYSGH